MGWRSWVKNRNALLTAAALVVGGCAFLLAQRYLRGQEVAVRAQFAGHYAAREVLVVAHDLPAGSVIEASMLARRAVPARFLASDALERGGVWRVVHKLRLHGADGGAGGAHSDFAFGQRGGWGNSALRVALGPGGDLV